MKADCPYAKSDMTPCVTRDGAICYALGNHDDPICVGCERTPAQTGVPPPADWAEQVAKVKRESATRDRRRQRRA